MSLHYTLLAFLNYGPNTGYDLKKHIDASTQNVWHASLSQIYPTLKKLEADGLVATDEVAQEGKPDKKIYYITDAGREKVLTWLAEPERILSGRKDAGLLKLFFSGSLPKERILHHLRTQLDLHQQQLHKYETDAQTYITDIVREIGLQREAVMWQLVRELGVESEKTTIRWLEQAIHIVREEYVEEEYDE